MKWYELVHGINIVSCGTVRCLEEGGAYRACSRLTVKILLNSLVFVFRETKGHRAEEGVQTIGRKVVGAVDDYMFVHDRAIVHGNPRLVGGCIIDQ